MKYFTNIDAQRQRSPGRKVVSDKHKRHESGSGASPCWADFFLAVHRLVGQI